MIQFFLFSFSTEINEHKMTDKAINFKSHRLNQTSVNVLLVRATVYLRGAHSAARGPFVALG